MRAKKYNYFANLPTSVVLTNSFSFVETEGFFYVSSGVDYISILKKPDLTLIGRFYVGTASAQGFRFGCADGNDLLFVLWTQSSSNNNIFRMKPDGSVSVFCNVTTNYAGFESVHRVDDDLFVMAYETSSNIWKLNLSGTVTDSFVSTHSEFIRKPIRIGDYYYAMCRARNGSHADSGYIIKLDAELNEVASYIIPSYLSWVVGFTYANNHIYLNDDAGKYLIKFNPANGEFTVFTINSGASLFGWMLKKDDLLFIPSSNGSTHKVIVFDTITETIIHTFLHENRVTSCFDFMGVVYSINTTGLAVLRF